MIFNSRLEAGFSSSDPCESNGIDITEGFSFFRGFRGNTAHSFNRVVLCLRVVINRTLNVGL